MKQTQNLNLKVFAKRLKGLREQHGLSTRQLAEIVRTSNATISRYETCSRNPDLLITYNIASYFNVSVEYLCGENTNTNIEIETLIEIYSQLSKEAKLDTIKYITYLFEKEK